MEVYNLNQEFTKVIRQSAAWSATYYLTVGNL